MCMLLGAHNNFLDCLDERKLTDIELMDVLGFISMEFLADYK
jgi:hypothetical protein